VSTVFAALRSKQEELGKLACCEPRHTATVLNPPKCQASVTLEAVLAQVGDFERFASHGLHGIPEDRLDMSDLYEHAEFEYCISQSSSVFKMVIKKFKYVRFPCGDVFVQQVMAVI
jgi:hypothetical protein